MPFLCHFVYLFSLPFKFNISKYEFAIHANFQDDGKTRNESNRMDRMNQIDGFFFFFIGPQIKAYHTCHSIVAITL